MLTGYGLVETSSMVSFDPPGAALPGSAGRPVQGMQVRIANPDADGIGDIEVRGPSLFAGYRNDPAKTQEAFTPDGWFRTGDLGSIDSRGYLHITARKTETIVLADGKKLFPEEFADSGHRDQPIRLIVITQTGDRDHAAHLGRGVPGGQHGVALVVTTDGCSLSFLRGLRQACEPGAVSFSGTALFGATSRPHLTADTGRSSPGRDGQPVSFFVRLKRRFCVPA